MKVMTHFPAKYSAENGPDLPSSRVVFGGKTVKKQFRCRYNILRILCNDSYVSGLGVTPIGVIGL